MVPRRRAAFLRDDDIWTVDVDGGSEPTRFRQTPHAEMFPVFSPDGKWLGYTSNEAGSHDLYVRPFPGGEPAHRISTGGAEQPVWSPDGRQLYWTMWTDADARIRRLWVADVDPASARLTRGRPRVLFERQLGGGLPVGNLDIGPDGRFVGIVEDGAEPKPVTQIQIVQNWSEGLKRLVPTR